MLHHVVIIVRERRSEVKSKIKLSHLYIRKGIIQKLARTRELSITETRMHNELMIIAAKIYDRYLHLNENETKKNIIKTQTRFCKMNTNGWIKGSSNRKY